MRWWRPLPDDLRPLYYRRRLIALQARVNELEGGSGTPAEIEAARIELQEQESFLENLIQLQAQYGISNYFGI